MKAALLVHLPAGSDSTAANADLFLKLAKHIQNTWGVALGCQVSDTPDVSTQAAFTECQDAVKQDSKTVPVHSAHALPDCIVVKGFSEPDVAASHPDLVGQAPPV